MGGSKQPNKICTITCELLDMLGIKRLPKQVSMWKEKEKKKKIIKTKGKNPLHFIAE